MAGLALAVWGGARGEAHEVPAKATTLRADLIQDYGPCTSPDTSTLDGAPACLGPDPSDTLCTFGSKGAGNLTLKITKTDIAAKAVVRGIAPLCDGQTLTATFTRRTTGDTCAADHCTLRDEEVRAGSCVVRKGTCRIRTRIGSGYAAGTGSAMKILGCGMKRGTLDTFGCGIMVR
jgi:hypothetical protein